MDVGAGKSLWDPFEARLLSPVEDGYPERTGGGEIGEQDNQMKMLPKRRLSSVLSVQRTDVEMPRIRTGLEKEQ